jgi:hypothetical protein
MDLSAGLVAHIGPRAPWPLQQTLEFIHCNYLFSIPQHPLKLIQRKFTTPEEEWGCIMLLVPKCPWDRKSD